MPAVKGKRTRLTNADLIALVREEGHTPDDIAEAHGITVAHVRTRLRQCGFDGEGADRPAPTEQPRALVVGWYADGDETWRDLAACSTGGYDPELWHPEGPGQKRMGEIAKRVCADCPVRARCLDAGLRAEAGVAQTYRFGIVGGLDVAERMALGAEAVA